MPVRTDPRADRSRTRALEVARAILVEDGWDALSHATVAERSGLHRATLYRHWPTPTALLRDLLAQEVAVSRITPTGDIRVDLIRALTVIQRELSRGEYGRILTALIDRGEWDTELHQIKVTITRAGTETLRQLLTTGAQAGQLSEHLDPDAGAALLLGPLLYRRLLSGERVTPTFIELVVDSFIAAHH